MAKIQYASILFVFLLVSSLGVELASSEEVTNNSTTEDLGTEETTTGDVISVFAVFFVVAGVIERILELIFGET